MLYQNEFRSIYMVIPEYNLRERKGKRKERKEERKKEKEKEKEKKEKSKIRK